MAAQKQLFREIRAGLGSGKRRQRNRQTGRNFFAVRAVAEGEGHFIL